MKQTDIETDIRQNGHQNGQSLKQIDNETKRELDRKTNTQAHNTDLGKSVERGGENPVPEIEFGLSHIHPISPSFEASPRRLRRFIQNPDRTRTHAVVAIVVMVDVVAVVVTVVVVVENNATVGMRVIAAAAVAGDSDLFEHTRLFAEFFEARVFFGTAVTQARVNEI